MNQPQTLVYRLTASLGTAERRIIIEMMRLEDSVFAVERRTHDKPTTIRDIISQNAYALHEQLSDSA